MLSRSYLVCLLTLLLLSAAARAQTPAFTYQGRLTDGSSAASGTYQMQFTLFGSPGGSDQIGSPIIVNPVSVATGGIFTVQLDFSPATPFATGADRWLEIAVRKTSDPPGFTTLTPRQQIRSSPFSIRTVSAGAADSLSASCVLCVTDSHISSIDGSKVTGTVANATNATTAGNVTGVVAIANGGTGSSTKNFVDLSTTQVVGGTKSFTGLDFGSPPSGILGQPVTTVLSTSSVSPGAGFVPIPGLSITMTIPAVCNVGSTACTAYISTDGGMQTTSAITTGVSRVDVVLTYDAALFPAGGYKRVTAANTGGNTTAIENWAFGYTTPVSTGTHTFAVFAALNSGSPATVGGNATSVLQGRLTVIIVRN